MPSIFPFLNSRLVKRRFPAMDGKARAVIEMRRAGRTPFLYPCFRARLAQRVPRAGLVYFNFAEERLADLEAAVPPEPQGWALEDLLYY